MAAYPNMDFLVATIQGHRLIVYGGSHIDVENTKADDEISSVLLTDVMHIGLLLGVNKKTPYISPCLVY